MSQPKGMPLEQVSARSNDPLAPYPQSRPSASEAANTQLPWWAESDYIPPQVQRFVEANAGLSLVCAAQLFFALMNVTVKYFIAETDISIPSLIFVRQFITVAGSIGTLWYLEEPYPLLGPPELRRLLLARGVFGTSALVCTYQSFQGLSVSDTTAIQFLGPTVLVVSGYLFLREEPTRRELFAGVFCLCGVLLVSRPPFIFGSIEQEVEKPHGRVNHPTDEGDELMTISRAAGVTWAFLSVFGGAVAYLIIRVIGKRAHALHSMIYFAGTCCLVTLPLVLFVPGQGSLPNSFKGFFLILLIGVFGFVAQTLLTMGLQREKAGRASLAIYTSVFFAIVLELVIFHTFPSLLSLLGVSIILTSGAWVAMQGAKAVEAARQDDLESAPLSRSTSPMPSPELTRRGEHYSYTTVSTTDEQDSATDHALKVPQNGGPKLGRRRSSGASSGPAR